VAATLTQSIDRVDASIAAMRDLITDLRPASLDQLGVEPALEALVERTRTLSGLDISIHFELASEDGHEPKRLSPDLETATYRLVQEALTNVVKHADATTVKLEVAERDGMVEVVVSDDGKGFDTAEGTDGFGLIGMRERVHLVGGRHEIESLPGRGTTVRALIPATRGDQRARAHAS
jgi:signal transduction histidine kinase